MRQLWVLLFIFGLAACEKPNPHPEVLDPIYRDYKDRKAALDAEINKDKSDLKGALAAVDDAEPQTGELKRAKRGVQILEDRIRKNSQESRYLGLLMEERRKYAVREYNIAYKSKTPWPPKEDFQAYQTSRRLREAPMSWDAHLPKLKSRIPAATLEKMKEEEEKRAAKSKSGGGH